MEHKKELEKIIGQARATKKSLGDLAMELDGEGINTYSLDEALDELDDVLSILEEYLEEL